MYCSNCGNKLPDDARFCDRCGNAIGSSPSGSASTGAGQAAAIPGRKKLSTGAIIGIIAGVVVIAAAVVVAAVLLLGGGNKAEAMQLYTAGLNRLGQSSVREVAVIDAEIEAQGTEMNMYMRSDVNVEGYGSNDVIMSGTASMNSMGSVMEYDMYYLDGYAYYNYYSPYSQQLKMEIPASMLDNTVKFTEADIISAEIENRGNTLEFVVNGSAIDVNSALGSMLGEGTTADYGNIEITAHLSDGYLRSIEMEFDARINMNGVIASASYDIDITYSDYGTAYVQLPGDLGYYQEVYY